MLPIDFSLELETAINKQISLIASSTEEGMAPVWPLVDRFQQAFLQLLADAAVVDIDQANYPLVDAVILFGPDAAWQQLTKPAPATMPEADMQRLVALWSIYALIDKSAQYYQQAAANTAHLATQIFFHSLYESKNILRIRFAGIIQAAYNQYWGKLGFAPFVLGKG